MPQELDGKEGCQKLLQKCWFRVLLCRYRNWDIFGLVHAIIFSIDLRISLIDQVRFGVIDLYGGIFSIVHLFHHLKTLVSLRFDLLFCASFRSALWVYKGTIFSTIGRCDYTLSLYTTWIKCGKSLRWLLKRELIWDVLFSVTTNDFIQGAIFFFFAFLGASRVDKAPNRNRAYTHNDRRDSHQHDLNVVGGAKSLKFLLEAHLLKHAIERVEGVLGVSDLGNYV